MGKKFNRWLRFAAQNNIDVGSLEQASATFTGQTSPEPEVQQQVPVQPKKKAPPAITRQERTRVGQLQTGVKSRQKKRTDRKNVQSLRIKLDQSALLANSGGSTPNLG